MLNRSRYLLLVFNDSRSPEERASAAAEAQLRADGILAAPVAPVAPAPADAVPAVPAADGQEPQP
jgi:rod shape-determining protein MreC